MIKAIAILLMLFSRIAYAASKNPHAFYIPPVWLVKGAEEGVLIEPVEAFRRWAKEHPEEARAESERLQRLVGHLDTEFNDKEITEA